ncbi:MAG: polysaccharide biosynthesis tyrosine autokinase [Bacteroidetes bacterium]|nr:polysaccharide biosynthesis tyrosine autokinase [Bacteroidota bacterium]
MNQNKQSQLVDIDDLKLILRVFLANWYVILGAVVISYFIASVYTYKLTDIYAARTQILLKSNDQYNKQSLISENFNYYQSYMDNSNEMRVMRSFDLIKESLTKLNLDVSYFIVGRLKTTEMFESTPFYVKVFSINPSLYEEFLKFRIINPEKYEISYLRDGLEQTKVGYFGKEFIDPDFKFLVTKTGTINSESIDYLKATEYKIQIHDIQNLIYKYQASISVENPEYTNILQVTVEDEVPGRAVLFLDTLAKVYIENTLKSRFDVNRNTISYIERQMSEVTTILNSIEDTMQDYKENKAILDLTKEEQDYFTKISSFDTRKSEIKLQLEAMSDLEKYIIEDKDPAFLPPSAYLVNGDHFLTESVAKLYSFQIQKNSVLSGSTEKSFPIQELDQNISKLKANVLTYISNLRNALSSRLENIEIEIGRYVSGIKSIPQKQRDLVNIQRQLDINEKMYVFLLERRSSAIIAKASIVPETRIIESARSIGVVRPNKTKIAYTFVGIAVGIALLFIFIRSVLFMKIESLEQLKKNTTVPIFGEIIYSDLAKDSYIVVDADPKSLITESFRTVRTNLEYVGSSTSRSKTILVTSNNPGEGKTFCSINLAVIIAKAGKKVMLIELDLHKPKVQVGLKMTSDIGVSNILIGKADVKDCILHSAYENLDVILSGPNPPNASELILSPKLEEMLNYTKEQYDYIIIDTAPVGLISDALIIMKQTDAVLFVANTKFASKQTIKDSNDIILTNKMKNVGYVLNSVKQKKSRYYYNRYGYGYGYGYGSYGGYTYGYGGSEKKS